MKIINIILKYAAQDLAFLLLIVFLFNELTAILINLNLFESSLTSQIGYISVLLATNNLLSNKFLGIKIT